jgi:hypothetical protein
VELVCYENSYGIFCTLKFSVLPQIRFDMKVIIGWTFVSEPIFSGYGQYQSLCSQYSIQRRAVSVSSLHFHPRLSHEHRSRSAEIASNLTVIFHSCEMSISIESGRSTNCHARTWRCRPCGLIMSSLPTKTHCDIHWLAFLNGNSYGKSLLAVIVSVAVSSDTVLGKDCLGRRGLGYLQKKNSWVLPLRVILETLL